ncbi:hypothetical protein PR048_013475 [Dryococelus australis]|uniref:Uncharacterized protein n=1 Tax=Dryococelus australis TaxID=614101 RepID=A0ABQ9HT34_9NEOP|nr:hypothetical protein PR048_013475 [Dryococelus australis]
MNKLPYLEHIVNVQGNQPSPERLQQINGKLPPQMCKQQQLFAGILKWFYNFIPSFAMVAVPLTNLLSPKFQFHEYHLLTHPNYCHHFYVKTNVKEGLGMVLCQLDAQDLCLIDYCLAVMCVLKHYLYHLEVSEFTTRMDNQCLIWLESAGPEVS